MAKFDVGDRVVVNDRAYANVGKHGVILRILAGYGSRAYGIVHAKLDDGTTITYWEYKLDKEENSMDNLTKGDIILDSDGDKVKVLEVFGDLVALSEYGPENSGAHKRFSTWRTVDQLKDEDYKVPAEDQGNVELTLEEVAEKLEIPVDKLRIKD